MDTSARAARALRLGRAGERAAAAYLESLGYEVIGRGFKARRGEIDIICRRRDELVLVEVKTRSSDAFGTPAEAVNAAKQRALRAAAAEYRVLSRWRGPISFAVVSLMADPNGDVVSAELIHEPLA